MARKRKVERFFETARLNAVFVAAVHHYGHTVWESPEGPAIVRDVRPERKGRFKVIYRLISVWGKEAW